MGTRYRFKDTFLLDATEAGERLIAVIRLITYLTIGLIPFSQYLLFEDSRIEVFISFVITALAVSFAVLVYWIVSKNKKLFRLGWVVSFLDISLVTIVLLLIALNSNPVIATNSLVIWQIYGIIIFATSLRLNLQMTVFTGLLAAFQYMLLVIYLDLAFDLSEQQISSNGYGLFSWPLQLGRIAIITIMTLVAAFFVLRVRKLVIYSGTDSLTGLKNRAYFEHVFPLEIAKSVSKQQPLALVFLDFDEFKAINDEYGHAVGDSTLRAVGEVFTEHYRSPYKVARWGGEEFAFLLPNTTKEEAVVLINALRKVLAAGVRVNPRLVLELTVSVGIVECAQEGTQPLDLINLADDRMLQAKNTGRDKIVFDS
ncbi:diguanylate cyclase [Kangiella sp. TOML190]|uniref:GGDEF domain-containing protein n=1 Tax=Kangiella sp. TOML190 TaxID=2931351 RepID=UPI0020409CC4|nr:GGDEF domain-containing protein [Kangiella sp. TOML190]